ncbi:MAG: hypothetical protein M9894_31675 [Planctomycetes bacterium]|nr:hypothetical protein [Planctomycetota bacterium]
MSGGSPELKDDAFPKVARDLPAGRGTPVVRTANADRRLDAPDPDRPAHDYTGRYLGRDDSTYLGGHPRARLLVNQAGIHVEVLLLVHEGRIVAHLMGDLEVDGDCRLVGARDERAAGHIEPSASGLTLTVTGSSLLKELGLKEPGSFSFRRYDPRPSYFLHAFEDAPSGREQEVTLARNLEHWPLHGPLKDRRLAAMGKGLKKELEAFFSISGTSVAPRNERNLKLRQINAIVKQTFAGLDTIDADQLEQAARAWVSDVRTTFVDAKEPLPYREWLAKAIHQTKTDGFRDPSGDIKEVVGRLGIRAAEQRSTFTATLVFEGVSSPSVGWIPSVKGYVAELELRQEGPSPWTATYTLWFGGVGWGLDAGMSLPLEGNKSAGAGTSEFVWQPDEVTGWVSLAGASATAAAGAGTSKGVSTLIIQGARTQTRPLILDMSDLDLASLEVTKKKAGTELGVEASLLVGRVVSRGKTSMRKTRPPEEVTRKAGPLAREQAAAVHFERLGSAIVSAAGFKRLRRLAALELPAFMDRASRLAITGHTDRVDTFDRNLWLAYYRVQNVRRALDDILGKRLKIASGSPQSETLKAVDVEGEDREFLGRLRVGNVTLQWLGELHALRDGEPDRRENEKYRRVDLVLNHQMVLTLGG